MTPYVRKIIKPWGYELIFTPKDSPVVGKIIHIIKAARLSYQYHDTKRETLCLITGQADLIINGQEIQMEPKKGYDIKPMTKHRLIGLTDCDIVEASTKEEGNTIRLEDDYQRPTETPALRNSPNRGWKGNK